MKICHIIGNLHTSTPHTLHTPYTPTHTPHTLTLNTYLTHPHRIVRRNGADTRELLSGRTDPTAAGRTTGTVSATID